MHQQQTMASMIKLKNILSEQLFGLASTTGVAARTGFNLSKGAPAQTSRGRVNLDTPDWDQGVQDYSAITSNSKEKIQKLFKTARTWQ